MDLAAAGEWIRARVEPTGAIELVRERPWATVHRVPLAGGAAWFKACAPVQAFEPRLTAALFARWPDRVPHVLGHDEDRAWLLLEDAGTPVRVWGNPPGAWLTALPRYAELQRGEASHAGQHLAHGVPDLRLTTLPDRYDDLHAANLYVREGRFRVLDWGDASIAHAFMSLVVTFRFLEETNQLRPGDPWFTRLRDAYLEPWGPKRTREFEQALRVGAFAHAIAWARQRDALPAAARPGFDR